MADNQGFDSNPATVTLTVSGGRKGGGGAMQWWSALLLALITAANRLRNVRYCRGGGVQLA